MKTIYKILLLALLFFSCKITTNEEFQANKKTNILERTKWKASGATVAEGDSILDFYTSDSVREFIVLNGIEKLGRHGFYKVKRKTRVKIEFSKLKIDHLNGTIGDKTMELAEETSFKKTKYYKVDEY